ncbi:Hypothetical_protein [Hexamita inflata]|uniref:Hypothetical_protein n=1 Tax=Hexamita inflata TaxID=28002 RepID=A0ABP1GJN1_9EUKA
MKDRKISAQNATGYNIWLNSNNTHYKIVIQKLQFLKYQDTSMIDFQLQNQYTHPHQTLAAIISANKESPYFLAHDNGMCYFIIESNISEAPCVIKQSKVVITQQPTVMISTNLYAFDMTLHPPVAYQGSLYLHYGQRTLKVTGQHYNFAVGNAYPFKVNEQLYLCQNKISYLNDKPVGQCKDIRRLNKLGVQNRDIQQFTVGKYIITFNQQDIEVYDYDKSKRLLKTRHLDNSDVLRQLQEIRVFNSSYYVENGAIKPIQHQINKIFDRQQSFKMYSLIYFVGIYVYLCYIVRCSQSEIK